ncbi:MAG: TadE/TadG family type IV pilus assembly protein [Anaerolineae bacterium]
MTEYPTKVNVSKRRCRKQRGQSLVEMALVLPLLLLLVAAVADFGRAFNSYIVITNAAREGARVGAWMPEHTHENDMTYIEGSVLREALNSGVDLSEESVAKITIEPSPGDREVTKPITVTVEYSMTTIFTGLVGLEEIPMRSRSAMVIYGILD